MTHANDNDSFNFMAALHAVRDHELATEKMHQIECMLQTAKDTMETYCYDNRDEWIDQEMLAHASRTAGQALQKHDLYERDDLDITILGQHAAEIVDARIEDDIAKEIEPFRGGQKFLVNSVAGKRDMLNMDVHVINQSFRKQYTANRDAFEATKTEQVTAARDAGSDHPERDVYDSYKSQQVELETTRQSIIATLHDDYGFTYELAPTLSQSFGRGV